MPLFWSALVLLFLTVSLTSATNDAVSAEMNENLKLLKVQLEKAAGVFLPGDERIQKYGLEKTVFVTAANYGFLNHLLNFFCYVKHLKMKVLVVSLDKKLDDYLNSHNSSQIISFHMKAEHGGEVHAESAQFRSQQFNLMTERKKEVVFDVLKLGYDVLFSDTDVVMLEDPFPFLMWKNMDYVHSLNEPCNKEESWTNFLSNPESEGNTGYYFMRSNPRTVKLLGDLLTAMDAKRELDDQSIFWTMLRQRKDPPVLFAGKCRDLEPSVEGSKNESTLRTCVLDPCLFSSGMMRGPNRFKFLFDEAKIRKQKVVTIHANWLNGGKMKEDTLHRYGYWVATSPTELGRCTTPAVH